MKAIVNKAVAILQNGGVILYPSDTVWGLACDATNTHAVETIFKIKKRKLDKSILIQVLDENMLKKYALVTININAVNEKFLDQPITIVYPYKKGLSPFVVINNTVAARIVKDEFTQQLLQKFNKPIASTSANISGKIMPKKYSEIAASIKDIVDFIVPLKQDELMCNVSKILKIEEDEIIILR